MHEPVAFQDANGSGIRRLGRRLEPVQPQHVKSKSDGRVHGIRHVVDEFVKRGQRIDYCVVGEPSSDQVLGDRVQIVGDDLFVTNTKRLAQGIKENAANLMTGLDSWFYYCVVVVAHTDKTTEMLMLTMTILD